MKNSCIILSENEKGSDYLGDWAQKGDDIKNDLKETDGVDWIHQAQDRVQWWALVNTVMNLPVL
jgi:hypothetical protein